MKDQVTCDICNPSKEDDDDDCSPAGSGDDNRRHHNCEEDHDPEPPKPLPPCDDGGKEPDDCSSAEKIAERERKLNDDKTAEAQLKLDIENKTKALEDLKAKSQQLEQAISDYAESKDQRHQRECACREFYRCKKPCDICTEDEECVKDRVEEYGDKLGEYWDYVDRLTRLLGQARIATKRAERKYAKAEAHFERIRNQAAECLAECEDLQAKYREAEEAGDQCLMFLYWHEIGKLLDNADCLDEDKYKAHLCCAFEWAVKAKDELNAALLAQDRLERKLEWAEQRAKWFEDNKWTIIRERIARCCCRKPATSEPPKQEQSGCSPTQSA